MWYLLLFRFYFSRGSFDFSKAKHSFRLRIEGKIELPIKGCAKPRHPMNE